MRGSNPPIGPSGLELEDIDFATLSDMLSYYDGLFTGMAVGPETIPPSEWLPLIIDDDEFHEHEDKEAATGLLLMRYNEVRASIENGAFEPIFEEGPDGELDGVAWAEGFVKAMGLRRAAWSPLIDSKSDRSLLAPILLLLTDESADIDSDEMLTEIRDNAFEYIPECVFEIDEFWRRRGRRNPALTAPRVAPKIGRNEPCPCGSGKKFKKCCGA